MDKLDSIRAAALAIVLELNGEIEEMAEAKDLNSFELSAEVIRQLVETQTNLTILGRAK